MSTIFVYNFKLVWFCIFCKFLQRGERYFGNNLVRYLAQAIWKNPGKSIQKMPFTEN